MSEISKLYENAGVYDFRYDCNVSFADGDFGCITNCSKGEVKDYCTDKKYFKKAKVINVRHLYPPFTAEKQLRLTTFIGLHYGFQMLKNEAFDYIIATKMFVKYKFEYKGYGYGYDETIANLINNLWQSLTPEEKQQVKGILE